MKPREKSPFIMRASLITFVLLSMVAGNVTVAGEAKVQFSGEMKRNNLVSHLLEVASISKSGNSFAFTRSRPGWIFVSAAYDGKGSVKVVLDKASGGDAIIAHDADGGSLDEAVRYVAQGEHQIQVDCDGDIRVEKLVVKAIPELIHCGLGFNSAIKSYGLYDMEFLKKDILPNVTTLDCAPQYRAFAVGHRWLAPPGETVRRRGRHQRAGQDGRRAFQILDGLRGQGAFFGRHHRQRVHRQ